MPKNDPSYPPPFRGRKPSFTPPSMGGSGSLSMGVHMAIVNTRQDQREFTARDGWKVVIDQLTKRSNVFKA